jgi:hypothetical protein
MAIVTQDQWLRCTTDPTWMINAIRNRVSARKYRLFAVACAQLVLPHVPAPYRESVLDMVEMAERFAEGNATVAELLAIQNVFRFNQDTRLGYEVCVTEPHFAAQRTVELAPNLVLHNVATQAQPQPLTPDEINLIRESEQRKQTDLARCIFGNPLKKFTFQPSWCTTDTVTLAERIYEERDFTLLPILADALQDAGCEDELFVGHCLAAGPHARGCWVVDLLLGKL